MKPDRKNHDIAWEYFVTIGQIPRDAEKNKWVLHHIDTELKTRDKARYDQWRVEDLQPMTRSEHMKLHTKGRKLSPETIEKIASKNRGRKRSEESKRKISEATKLALQDDARRTKMSSVHKGQVPWNKGMKKARPKKFPQKGRIWVTNGSKDFKVPPNEIPEGYMPGRAFHYMHTEETKAKMRKPKSEATRAKMSAAMKGKPKSAEHCAKMSAVMKGKKHTEATKAKMSATRTGKPKSAEFRAMMRNNHWWNNGVKNKFCKECPGEGWTRGQLNNKRRT